MQSKFIKKFALSQNFRIFGCQQKFHTKIIVERQNKLNLPKNIEFMKKDLTTLANEELIKESKNRKLFRCKEIATGKIYLFHPLAEVEPFEKESITNFY